MANNASGLISGLTGMVNQVKMNILKKFRAFYLKRVHETDLAPTKTFSFDFDINSGGTAHRRSLSKLKALIVKSLLKNNPVVALAEKEFMPLEGSHSHVHINMFNIEFGATKPTVNDKVLRKLFIESRTEYKSINSITLNHMQNYSRISDTVIRSSVKYLQIERYVRYLRYLCRKNEVPVTIGTNYEIDMEKSNDFCNVYKVYIIVKFGLWIPTTVEFENRLANALQGNDDALFSDPSGWTMVDFAHTSSSSKFKVAAFFTHLDKVVKVVDTLTRKIDYGYNAFSFRTA